MEMIREWIITIISVIVFITFIEMLLPNSDNRRYINVVIGLLIISIVLKPISSVLSNEILFDETFLRVSSEIDKKTMANRLESVDFNQKENVLSIYKNELKRQMKSKIESQFSIVVREIKLDIEKEDKEKFGMLNKIILILEEQKKMKSEDRILTNIEEIKVSVSITVAEKNNDNIIDEKSIVINKKSKEIKNILSNFYKISKDDITIKTHAP
ncbi:MAG: stage III sporulation protein AF [Alkaliphilus sp.]